ncbi:MAG: Tfp pilus assembly protein PilP [Sulfitobacter sp.]|jgi:Tfp pilus assembly protein PilP
MASQNEAGQTPQKVADLATEQVRLERTALIGIFGSTAAPGALLRGHNGKIERVTIGDRFGGGTVAAISEDSLILTKRGKNTVLKLPKA